MWSQACAHVIFDTDPAPRGGHEPAKPEEMCQAMIRYVQDNIKDTVLNGYLKSQYRHKYVMLFQRYG